MRSPCLAILVPAHAYHFCGGDVLKQMRKASCTWFDETFRESQAKKVKQLHQQQPQASFIPYHHVRISSRLEPRESNTSMGQKDLPSQKPA